MKFRSIILGVLLFQCAVCAQYSVECPVFSDPNDYIEDPNILDNGLFECGDPNLTTYNFTPPIYWERIPEPSTTDDCYAALHSSLEPSESRIDWDIAGPYQGDSFVLLSTGHPDTENSNSSAIKASMISQEVFLYEGDAILGVYFFGTSDYLHFNDYASICLEPVYPENEPNEPILLAHCDVETVGDYESTLGLSPLTDGWIPFLHIIEPNQVGSYHLRCKVTDFSDAIYDSYLAVDGLRICRGGKPLSDLNDDCDVNLIDYSILSEAWLSFCPVPSIDDPNFPGDPNDYPPPADPNIMDNCLLADFDNSWFVDPNDLIIMSDEWLITPPPE